MSVNKIFNDYFLKPLADTRITVVCLFLLFVLTLWGTIAQVHQGLYIAQERFFNSFYFLAAGFLPFPGAQLVLWVMFFNLVAATITRFRHYKKWPYAGILIIHFGLWLYFAAAFVTLQLSKESNVHLSEGSSTNVSASYTQWELAYWKDKSAVLNVTAVDLGNAKSGTVLPFKDVPWLITVDQYYPNASAFTKTLPASGVKAVNASGITLLQPKSIEKEREKNVAGGVFTVQLQGQQIPMILYGLEDIPTPISVGQETFYFSLRHSRQQLPFTVKLDSFKAEFHPGTEMAKSYESWVEVSKPGGSSRKAHIYMNNPLREKDFTFYQASYETDEFGRKYSTLAVVQNAGQWMPYVACLIVFLGLAVHFFIAAFGLIGKKK